MFRDCQKITFDNLMIRNIISIMKIINAENSKFSIYNGIFENLTTVSPYIIEISDCQNVSLQNLQVRDFYPIFVKFSYSVLTLRNISFFKFKTVGTLETSTIQANFQVEFNFTDCEFNSLNGNFNGPVRYI